MCRLDITGDDASLASGLANGNILVVLVSSYIHRYGIQQRSKFFENIRVQMQLLKVKLLKRQEREILVLFF